MSRRKEIPRINLRSLKVKQVKSNPPRPTQASSSASPAPPQAKATEVNQERFQGNVPTLLLLNVCICMSWKRAKPKPALPNDAAKLEARAKSNPLLRPPSTPPPKSPSPATGTPIVKMLMVPVGPVSSFDFAIFWDCEEGF